MQRVSHASHCHNTRNEGKPATTTTTLSFLLDSEESSWLLVVCDDGARESIAVHTVVGAKVVTDEDTLLSVSLPARRRGLSTASANVGSCILIMDALLDILKVDRSQMLGAFGRWQALLPL